MVMMEFSPVRNEKRSVGLLMIGNITGKYVPVFSCDCCHLYMVPVAVILSPWKKCEIEREENLKLELNKVALKPSWIWTSH
jgi:hypothetical protein